MVNLEVINSIIIKCSNNQIKERLSKLSVSEKNEKLDGKLNSFEKKDYDDNLNLLEFLKMDDNPSDFIKYQIEKTEDILFDYEKRIYRGYDLDKHKKNIPEYNLNDYVEDNRESLVEPKYNPELGVSIGNIEEKEMNAQRNIIFSDDEIDALKYYFGKGYLGISAELSSKYKRGVWDTMPKDERNKYHKMNSESIPLIDSAMNKSDGLGQNTILYHGVRDTHLVDIHTLVGDKIKLDGYVSATFSKYTGRGYGEEVGDEKLLYVKFLAPKGTKGVCPNSQKLSSYPNEHEYLLDRGLSGTVVDINYDNGEVTVLLEE